jgi:sodium transport system permease protein
MLRQAVIIARKEIVDHVREVRSLWASCLHVLMGPIVISLVLFSMRTAPHSKAEAALTGMTAIFLLISVFVGGMNLAMDILAGERERRSLLPLLLNPVSRGSIVLGKWLAVFLFAAGSLILATGAFAITFGVANIRLPLFSPQRLFSWSVLGLLPLAGLAAALQLTLSTFCRTAKEAQTYLSLLMFVPMGITMFLLFVEPKPPVWVECLPIAGHQALLSDGSCRSMPTRA